MLVALRIILGLYSGLPLTSVGMTCSFPRIRAAFGLARAKLDESDGVVWQAVSGIHREKLEDLIPQCELDTDHKELLLSILQKCRFLPHDRDILARMLTPVRFKDARGKSLRTVAQDYTALINLIPEFLLKPFMDENNTPSLKKQLLFAWLCKLGLRNADAYTEKMINSAWLFFSMKQEKLQQLSPMEKFQFKEETKEEFKMRAARAPKIDILKKLPHSPQELQTQRKDLWCYAMGSSALDFSPLVAKDILLLDSSYFCRKSKNEQQSRSRLELVPVEKQPANVDGQGAWMATMFNAMKDMQLANQDVIKDLIVHDQRPAPLEDDREPKGVSALRTLRDNGTLSPVAAVATPLMSRSRGTYRKMPTIDASTLESYANHGAPPQTLQEAEPALVIEEVNEEEIPRGGAPETQLAPVPAPGEALETQLAPVPAAGGAPAPKRPAATLALKPCTPKRQKPNLKDLTLALAERDSERKEAQSDKRKEAALAKRVADKAANGLSSFSGAPLTLPSKPANQEEEKQKGAPANEKEKTPVRSKLGNEKEQTPVKIKPEKIRFGPPCFSKEFSRCQIMCRTGFRGVGQSYAITYTGHKTRLPEYSTAEEAVEAAKAWVARERKSQGLDVGDEFMGSDSASNVNIGVR